MQQVKEKESRETLLDCVNRLLGTSLHGPVWYINAIGTPFKCGVQVDIFMRQAPPSHSRNCRHPSPLQRCAAHAHLQSPSIAGCLCVPRCRQQEWQDSTTTCPAAAVSCSRSQRSMRSSVDTAPMQMLQSLQLTMRASLQEEQCVGGGGTAAGQSRAMQ